MNKRIVARILLGIGSLFTIAGFIFITQSVSWVGPRTSFMYGNSEWTYNGFIILGVGIVTLACSVGMWIYNRKARSSW
jgi:hypothetical protein